MQAGAKPIASRNNLLSTVASRINSRAKFALEGGIFIAGAGTQCLRDGLNFFKSAAESHGKPYSSKRSKKGVFF